VLASLAIGAFKAAVVLPAVASVGAKVAKMMSAVKAGEKLLGAVEAGREAIAKVQKAKNLAVKSCCQFITDKTGLDKIESIVQRVLTAGCAIPVQ
jgi:hypothetical protein